MEARIFFVGLQLKNRGIVKDIIGIIVSYINESCAKCLVEWEGKYREDITDFRANHPMFYCWFCELYYHQFCFENHRNIVLPLHKLYLPFEVAGNLEHSLISCGRTIKVFCKECEKERIPCKCSISTVAWYFHMVEDRYRPRLMFHTSGGKEEAAIIKAYAKNILDLHKRGQDSDDDLL